MRESLSGIERQLAAKEAYLAAKLEMSSTQRLSMLGEVLEMAWRVRISPLHRYE